MFTVVPLLLAGALLPNLAVGGPLDQPAQVAGPWEGLVAPGEIAGISLHVIDNADGTVRSVYLGTYVRKDGKTTRTWWSSPGTGTDAFDLQSGGLHFRQSRNQGAPFDVALDLSYDPAHRVWKGSFSNPLFSGQVVLRRPNMQAAMTPTGTWRTDSVLTIWPSQRVREYGCLNIGLGQDGALVLWSEDHNVFLGLDKDKRPIFGDSFGEMLDDPQTTRYVNEWSFIVGTGMGGYRFTGIVSSDGLAFGGFSSDHYGNGVVAWGHPQRPFAWTRMLDLTCRP